MIVTLIFGTVIVGNVVNRWNAVIMKRLDASNSDAKWNLLADSARRYYEAHPEIAKKLERVSRGEIALTDAVEDDA